MLQNVYCAFGEEGGRERVPSSLSTPLYRPGVLSVSMGWSPTSLQQQLRGGQILLGGWDHSQGVRNVGGRAKRTRYMYIHVCLTL